MTGIGDLSPVNFVWFFYSVIFLVSVSFYGNECHNLCEKDVFLLCLSLQFEVHWIRFSFYNEKITVPFSAFLFTVF